jgi:hypothetical protein
LSPDGYNDALNDLRVALKELAVRHEVEVGQVRAERDELRALVADLEAQAARYREKLRALGALDEVEVEKVVAGGSAVVLTRGRVEKQQSFVLSKATAKKSARPSAPDYHVSTSSSSAEKQIIQLQQQRQPVAKLPSTGSDDGSSRHPKSSGGSRSEKRVSRPSKSSSSSSSGPPLAELLALSSDRGRAPPVATSVAAVPAGDATGSRADTYSSNTFGSVQIGNAEDVVHVRHSQSSESSVDEDVQRFHPEAIEIVETVEVRNVREVVLSDD